MFSIELSNGTKLVASVDFKTAALVVTQEARPVPGAALPAPVGRISIPLTDLKRTAETVTQLVRAFRG